jgi:hypothetical protein
MGSVSGSVSKKNDMGFAYIRFTADTDPDPDPDQ